MGSIHFTVKRAVKRETIISKTACSRLLIVVLRKNYQNTSEESVVFFKMTIWTKVWAKCALWHLFTDFEAFAFF